MTQRRIAAIFDLDGTLVQTEALKARSYARAAVELRPDAVAAQDIIVAYNDMVGRSREEVAAALLARFGLGAEAERRMGELDVSTPLDAYMALRLRVYESMIANGELIREQEYPWATALLRDAKRAGYRVGIATMSHGQPALMVLERLGLTAEIDALATRDDVQNAKPSPEIYLLTAERLGAEPRECFVLEDSVPGIRAANAAGMCCLAITNDMTRDAVHAAAVLPPERIVDDPARLGKVARSVLEELAQAR